MESRQQELSYKSEADEWADLSAWQGYEFWSAQLEAEMAFLSELEQALGATSMVQEGKSDGLPF